MALVRSSSFADFVKTLASDELLDAEYRAFVICSISGGLRVSEALDLTKESFLEDPSGALYFKTKVLKKRKADTRWARVHPAGETLVKQVLANKIGKLFNWTAGTAFVRAKKFFKIDGLCNHSFRHSAVSYFLFEERLTSEQAAKLIHINSKIIDTYAHLDERATLAKCFK